MVTIPRPSNDCMVLQIAVYLCLPLWGRGTAIAVDEENGKKQTYRANTQLFLTPYGCSLSLLLIRHGFAVPPSPQEKAHDGRCQPTDKPKFEPSAIFPQSIIPHKEYIHENLNHQP